MKWNIKCTKIQLMISRMWKYLGNTTLEDSRAFRAKLVDKVQRDLQVARVRRERGE